MKNVIGKKLDAIRQELRLSQHKLAELAGVPIATLQRILWGKSAKEENLAAVADAMGYEIVLVKVGGDDGDNEKPRLRRKKPVSKLRASTEGGDPGK